MDCCCSCCDRGAREVETTEVPELTEVLDVDVAVEVEAASGILLAIRYSIRTCCAPVKKGGSVSSWCWVNIIL